MSSSSSFGRTIFQGFVIIISVMLAFGASNLWNDQAIKKDELESLELVLRDLGDSIEELQDFSTYSKGAFNSALGAYSALSRRAPYDKNTVRADLLRVDRYTLSLPASAYTDLLASGELNVISNRSLRDSIVRFYEWALTESEINDNFCSLLLFVDIAIKPFDDPAPINLGASGLTPIAIASTDDFDATCIDPEMDRLCHQPEAPTLPVPPGTPRRPQKFPEGQLR